MLCCCLSGTCKLTKNNVRPAFEKSRALTVSFIVSSCVLFSSNQCLRRAFVPFGKGEAVGDKYGRIARRKRCHDLHPILHHHRTIGVKWFQKRMSCRGVEDIGMRPAQRTVSLNLVGDKKGRITNRAQATMSGDGELFHNLFLDASPLQCQFECMMRALQLRSNALSYTWPRMDPSSRCAVVNIC